MLIFGKKCFSNFMSVVALLDNSTCKSVGSDFCVQLSLEDFSKKEPINVQISFDLFLFIELNLIKLTFTVLCNCFNCMESNEPLYHSTV